MVRENGVPSLPVAALLAPVALDQSRHARTARHPVSIRISGVSSCRLTANSLSLSLSLSRASPAISMMSMLMFPFGSGIRRCKYCFPSKEINSFLHRLVGKSVISSAAQLVRSLAKATSLTQARGIYYLLCLQYSVIKT